MLFPIVKLKRQHMKLQIGSNFSVQIKQVQNRANHTSMELRSCKWQYNKDLENLLLPSLAGTRFDLLVGRFEGKTLVDLTLFLAVVGLIGFNLLSLQEEALRR